MPPQNQYMNKLNHINRHDQTLLPQPRLILSSHLTPALSFYSKPTVSRAFKKRFKCTMLIIHPDTYIHHNYPNNASLSPYTSPSIIRNPIYDYLATHPLIMKRVEEGIA